MRKIVPSLIALLFAGSIMILQTSAFAADQTAAPPPKKETKSTEQPSQKGTDPVEYLAESAEERVRQLWFHAGMMWERNMPPSQSTLLKAGGATLGFIGLTFADEDIQDWSQENRTDNLGDIARGFDFLGSFWGVFLTNSTMAGIGYLSRDSEGGKKFLQTVGVSAVAQSFSGIMVNTLKFTVGRARPDQERGNSSFDPFSSFNTSFPSGHTAQAWTMATVFASYYDHPVPLIGYTYATLMGLSRIYLDKHWASDVFAGAVLGYFVGKAISAVHMDYKSKISIAPFYLASKRGKGIAFTYRF